MAVPRTLRRTRWRWRLGCGMACVLGLGLVWAAVLWQIARVTTCPECSAAHEIGRNAFRAAWFLHRSHWRAQGSGLQQCPARVFWLEPGAPRGQVLIKSTCKDASYIHLYTHTYPVHTCRC